MTDYGRVLDLAQQLADAAREFDGVVAWPPRPDGPLVATFMLFGGEARYLVTIEGPSGPRGFPSGDAA